jgi:hypothetical protein
MTPPPQPVSRQPVGRLRYRFSALSISLLAGTLILALLTAFWYFQIRQDYYPSGDEFSLLVNSTRFFHPSPLAWFSHGFSTYFIPYPDISLPYSNFLRPVDNLTYYLNSLLFGSSWSAYLLTNYAIAAAVVASVCLLCLHALRLSLITSAMIGLATAASPAFGTQFAYRPCFAFDYLAALWIFLVILSLTRRNMWMAWGFLSLAVFTKESAYYAAIAASIAASLTCPGTPRVARILRSAAFLLPLAAIGILRLVDFRNAAGVYVLSGFSPASALRGIALGLTHWPYIMPGEQNIRELSLRNIASLTLSLVLWALALTAARYSLRARALRTPSAALPTLPGHDGKRMEPTEVRTLVSIFFVCSLIMPVLLDLTPRFGASAFPLFLLVVGLWIEQSNASGLLRAGAALTLVLITSLNLVELGRVLSPRILLEQKTNWHMSRDLIHHLSDGNAPVTFLVDDTSENFSSPDSVKRFSGYPGQLVPISNLQSSCSVDLRVSSDPSRTYIVRSIVKPQCGSNVLYAAYRLDRLSGFSLERELPQATVFYQAKDRPSRKAEFVSQDLTVTLRPKVPRFAILIPDFRSQVYTDLAHWPGSQSSFLRGCGRQ